VPRDTPLREAAVNHVWTKAIKERLPEIESRLGRPVRISMLTADQLSSQYNVKLADHLPDQGLGAVQR
jgi:multiple sugar transport system substrate-binding protein